MYHTALAYMQVSGIYMHYHIHTRPAYSRFYDLVGSLLFALLAGLTRPHAPT